MMTMTMMLMPMRFRRQGLRFGAGERPLHLALRARALSHRAGAAMRSRVCCCA
jgi:hypothetical protein